jgi:ABC-type transport system involved in cytochrome c biogenesis ATPase subunit
MRALLQGAALGALRGADLELAPGRYVVLSSEREPLADLVAVLCGREPPRQGKVLVDGAAPAASPSLRRKLAALLPDEALPPAKTVSQSLEKALAARGASSGAAASLLEDAGLARLAALAPAALGARATRSVALALALAHSSAELFALHEPLATLVTPSFVLARLDEHTARGAIVLAATTSPADATLLGGAWLCVELGRVRATLGPAPRLGIGPWQQVSIETPNARELAQLLHESPHGLSSELGASARSLKVSGPALDVTVREVIALARSHQLEISRIEAAVPPVEALMASRAGFARGAYEAARSAAQAVVPPLSPRGAA